MIVPPANSWTVKAFVSSDSLQAASKSPQSSSLTTGTSLPKDSLRLSLVSVVKGTYDKEGRSGGPGSIIGKLFLPLRLVSVFVVVVGNRDLLPLLLVLPPRDLMTSFWPGSSARLRWPVAGEDERCCVCVDVHG